MKAVIFDLGNVLVHYDHAKTMAAVQGLCQIDEAGFWKVLKSADLEKSVGTGKTNGRSLHQYLQQQVNLTAVYDQFVTAFTSGQQRNEEAIAYAVALQQRPNVRVGIISNTNDIHSDWLHQHLVEFPQFDSVILSDEVGLLKPDAAIYHLSLSQLNISPNNALFIDDIAENITGANQVGMQAIHHTSWIATRPAIEKWLIL